MYKALRGAALAIKAVTAETRSYWLASVDVSRIVLRYAAT
jgi:hypothetical protein